MCIGDRSLHSFLFVRLNRRSRTPQKSVPARLLCLAKASTYLHDAPSLHVDWYSTQVGIVSTADTVTTRLGMLAQMTFLHYCSCFPPFWSDGFFLGFQGGRNLPLLAGSKETDISWLLLCRLHLLFFFFSSPSLSTIHPPHQILDHYSLQSFSHNTAHQHLHYHQQTSTHIIPPFFLLLPWLLVFASSTPLLFCSRITLHQPHSHHPSCSAQPRSRPSRPSSWA